MYDELMAQVLDDQILEFDVPIPRRSRCGANSEFLSRMVDDSSKFFKDRAEAISFYAALYHYLKNTRSKAVFRKMKYKGRNGYMVWRKAR